MGLALLRLRCHLAFYVKSDGTVQDGNYHTIGHAKDVNGSYAAE